MKRSYKKDLEDYILRYINVSAKKRLEWLQDMHEFTVKFTPEKIKKNWYRLREAR